MKQFSIEEYLKNPDRQIITRDGRNVRIICTDRNYGNQVVYPVVALVQENPYENSEDPYCYTKDGLYLNRSVTPYDLFFTSEKKEGWVNLYKTDSTITLGAKVYNTKEEAESVIGNNTYISTVKVEWEE